MGCGGLGWVVWLVVSLIERSQYLEYNYVKPQHSIPFNHRFNLTNR